MSPECLPIIVLVGVETKTFDLIESYIGHEYEVFPIDSLNNLDAIESGANIILFMVNSDNVRSETKKIIEKIHSHENLQNIPMIGLSLKKHYPEMEIKERYGYEDILLMPCGTDDLLTRINIWAKTYERLCKDEEIKKEQAEIKEQTEIKKQADKKD